MNFTMGVQEMVFWLIMLCKCYLLNLIIWLFVKVVSYMVVLNAVLWSRFIEKEFHLILYDCLNWDVVFLGFS